MARKKIGLALSGGAARGFAHLGVLKVLSAHDIPIDFIAGTSAGSFAGGAFAAGLSVEQILELGKKISWYKISGFPYSTRGILSNAPLGDIIKDNFPFSKFEDLPIPFAAVACSLETGDEVVFKDSGDLAFAIRASCAIPGVFAPLEDKDHGLLIDGGVVAPVPTKAVRELGADLVIAVDVISDGATFSGSPNTLLGVFFQAGMVLLKTAARHQHYHADMVIIPKIGHLRLDEIGKMDEFIKLGEEATLEKLDEIKALLANE